MKFDRPLYQPRVDRERVVRHRRAESRAGRRKYLPSLVKFSSSRSSRADQALAIGDVVIRIPRAPIENPKA